MSGIAETIGARHEVIKAVLEVLLAEQNLSDLSASTTALTDAEDRLALAARDLTRATNGLSIGRQPKGWVQTVSGGVL